MNSFKMPMLLIMFLQSEIIVLFVIPVVEGMCAEGGITAIQFL